jgi:hypothetical protein
LGEFENPRALTVAARVTQAMATGVSKTLWTMVDVVGMIKQLEPNAE